MIVHFFAPPIFKGTICKSALDINTVEILSSSDNLLKADCLEPL